MEADISTESLYAIPRLAQLAGRYIYWIYANISSITIRFSSTAWKQFDAPFLLNCIPYMNPKMIGTIPSPVVLDGITDAPTL
jgi:hypothetical protein